MLCLVSGAAGFIGSHLCERLVADGHDVIGIDNLSSGRESNLHSIVGHKRFIFVMMGIHLMSELDLIIQSREVDWIFHLAAMADVVPSIEKPEWYHYANVSGTVSILEYAKKYGAKRFIYAASSSCYGIPTVYPTPESYECSPQYPYALTKYLGEQYVMHWNKVYGLPAISLRLFNVFGPRSRTSGAYGAVFGTFLSQLYHGSPLTIVGDGEQSRDFTYVTDVVDAFVRAAEIGIAGQIYNVGSGVDQSVNRLAALLGGTSDGMHPVIHIPDRPGEPRRTCAKTKKIFEHMGWQPKMSFEEGVHIMRSKISEYKDAPLWTVDKIADATKVWFETMGEKR